MIKITRALVLGFALCAGSAAMAQTAGHEGHNHKADDHAGHNHDSEGHSAPKPDLSVAGAFSQVPSDHVIGQDSAPATLIVFASVTCPHCASWFEGEWPAVKADLVETGRAKVIFREFPTGPMPISIAGFLLADCGPEETYFDAIEWQMANQDRIREQMIAGQVRETHIEVGQAAGLSEDETLACLTDEAGFNKLNDAVTRARAAGLSAVPAMMINGELYDSKDMSAKALSTAIARASIAK